jgi:hypothetical protein
VKHADKGAHYEVHPEEAALVRRIFRLCVEDGLSSYAIAELLTREGVPTSLGQRRTLPALVWHPSTIASMALQHGLTDVLADLGFEGVNGVGKFGIGFYRAGRYMIFLGQTFPRFSENFFIFKRFLWSSIASLLQVIPLPPEIALLFGRQVAPSELQRNHPVNYRPGSLQRGIPL